MTRMSRWLGPVDARGPSSATFFFPGFLLTFWHKKVGARNPNITWQELGLVLRVFQKSRAKNPSVMGRVQF